LTQYVFESTRDAQGELIEIRKTIDEPEYDMFRDMLEDVRVERVQLKVDAGRGMASALERGSTATTVGETLLYRKANLMQPYPKVKPPPPPASEEEPLKGRAARARRLFPKLT